MVCYGISGVVNCVLFNYSRSFPSSSRGREINDARALARARQQKEHAQCLIIIVLPPSFESQRLRNELLFIEVFDFRVT